MFYSLSGEIVHSDANSFALSCGGVAFRCLSTRATLSKIGGRGDFATVYTHLNVREDALDLFGFSDENELDCFKLLIGVSGVGPKAALAILSELSPDKLALCIASGDAKSITRAQGVGAKLAQRVVLELKDKLAANLPGGVAADVEAAAAIAGGEAEEAVAALVMLGYSRSDAAAAVGRMDANLSAQDYIKQALKVLARNL